MTDTELSSVGSMCLVTRLQSTQDGRFQYNLGFSRGEKKVCCLYSKAIHLNALKVIVLLIAPNTNPV